MHLIILGAGGHGKTVAEVAVQLQRYDEILFLDDCFGNQQKKQHFIYGEKEIIGKCDEFENYISNGVEFYPAFGNNAFRLDWGNRIRSRGGNLATIIHPSAYVSPSAKIEEGTVLLPLSVVNTGCTIAKACIVNVGAIIDHGCIIEEGCHINAGAIVMPENRISKLTKIDSGMVVKMREFPV